MFTFFKGREHKTDAADVKAPGTTEAPDTSPAMAETEDHPGLAAMDVEAPDVPPTALADRYALELGALLDPPATPVASGQPEVGPKDEERTAALSPQIVEALSTIYDPEIPVNIYELGLIYGVEVDAENRVKVTMTLTSPACPSAQQLPSEARYKVKAVEGVTDAAVDVVWEPPWTKDLMSETARMALGMF